MTRLRSRQLCEFCFGRKMFKSTRQKQKSKYRESDELFVLIVYLSHIYQQINCLYLTRNLNLNRNLINFNNNGTIGIENGNQLVDSFFGIVLMTITVNISYREHETFEYLWKKELMEISSSIENKIIFQILVMHKKSA